MAQVLLNFAPGEILQAFTTGVKNEETRLLLPISQNHV